MELACNGLDPDSVNVSPDSGWFEMNRTREPTAEDLKFISDENIGDAALACPDNWEKVQDPSVVEKHVLPVGPDGRPAGPDFYVKKPFNGAAASAGNGNMVAFEARSQQQVRDLHAAALAAGGSDEGQPGFRADYGPTFFVGYLRDPQGNKIALYSSDENEPGRDD